MIGFMEVEERELNRIRRKLKRSVESGVSAKDLMEMEKDEFDEQERSDWIKWGRGK